ncbi:hypothetical protein GCM10008171_26860 [Methylopila jiangsuensis]|uniref:Uncharacterized protein n=1 Tax=Methylopila jiangsuensis TaxID=586230 RepID=A0A9W6JHR1_9HYPH|nr:hypothetical protein GCM10008171_26860 [Methylopila jiangsuensis]
MGRGGAGRAAADGCEARAAAYLMSGEVPAVVSERLRREFGAVVLRFNCAAVSRVDEQARVAASSLSAR